MLTQPQYIKLDYCVVVDIYHSVIFTGTHFILLNDGLRNVSHVMLVL
jgi:hypothetical protein